MRYVGAMDAFSIVLVALAVPGAVAGLVLLVVQRLRARPRREDGIAPSAYGAVSDPNVRSAPTAGMRGDVTGPGGGV